MRWRWLAACVLLLVGLSVAAYRGAVLREEARRVVIIIPPGTAERIEAGDPASVPPHQIEMVLGVQDILVIDNQDTVWHEVGPYWIAPGRTLTQRFTRPGVVRQACTMTSEQQVEIVVRER
jgi:hypothetical protein